MDVELTVVMWPTEMIYDSTLIAIGIPNAPAPTVLWPVETKNDLSSTRIGMLDSLVEVAAP
ncbi:hypothetical protein PVL29_006360 [Vitis rotundifolia]|uniref:Uncharacterized protein n=1 Tax=Vitis rotundifolia TaxID=103349 RepID=A0AA39DZC6_VITRO|nr:hypothetical protein PVL29_006360 [Vitis rotundifolia]